MIKRQNLGDLGRRMVIRADAPIRLWLVPLLVLLVGMVSSWLMYEYGRRTAGFDARQAAAETTAVQVQLDNESRQLREMRVQLAAREEATLAQVRERSEVAKTIGELQAQLARAQQDLQFYRGIANPRAAGATAVAIQQFSVLTRSAEQRQYTLRFALNRESRAETAVTGQVLVTIEGERAGSAASVDLQSVSDGRNKIIAFSFRYFANFEHPITLPEGFQAERVTIEVKLREVSATPYKKTFIWSPGA